MKYRFATVALSLIAVAIAPVLAGEAAEVAPELSKVVSQTNDWMTAPGASAAPEIAPKASATSLDRATRRDAAAMASRLAGARLIAIAVYQGKPTTLATDLSRQLRLVEDIPEEKRRPLLVDVSKGARADEVAAIWASDLLECNDRDAVAVCVYWFADEKTHSIMSGAEAEPQLHLVLTRFTRGNDSPYAIARTAWGPVADGPGKPADGQ